MMRSIDCYAHFAGDPYFNMAFDDWMAHHVSMTAGAVLLRIYTWKSPAITYGFHQRAERAFDHAELGDTPAIRRITGGRALLHEPSELTYAIGINLAGWSSPGSFATISSASKCIAEALVEFVGTAGLESHYMRVSSTENSNPEFFHTAPCFASHARHEVISNGKKLIASAQKRLPNGIFQHGSIKIGGVAKHPALNGVGDQEPSKAIEIEQFTQFSRSFFDVFSRRVSASSILVSHDELSNRWVANRQRCIAASGSEKRDIKHDALETSL